MGFALLVFLSLFSFLSGLELEEIASDTTLLLNDTSGLRNLDFLLMLLVVVAFWCAAEDELAGLFLFFVVEEFEEIELTLFS